MVEQTPFGWNLAIGKTAQTGRYCKGLENGRTSALNVAGGINQDGVHPA